MLDWIQQNAEEDTSVTRGEIMDYYMSQFRIKSTRGWVNSFVLRHSDEVIQPKSVEQEGQRSQVPGGFLERIIQDLHEYVQTWVAELVFNLDEVGISDWEDRKTKKVIVPAAIHDGVSRNVKHISVMACVLAAGESLLHYTVTLQNSPTVQEHLRKQGVRFGRDFALKWNQEPCFNTGIFLDHIRTIFLTYIDTLRDDVIRLLTEARMRVMTFASHTTQVFQLLDV
jgi:hypothetical protein